MPTPSPSEKRALITGITGQDGSYLAELLLGKGYQVHGLVRRSSHPNTARIDHLLDVQGGAAARLYVHESDVTDAGSLAAILRHCRPHEVYHLAAQSHVKVSFDQPVHTADVTAVAATKMLEAVHQFQQQCDHQVRYYQASSSEMFGKVAESPQTESTPFHPRSPYGAAKLYAHCMTINYRESYGLHASCGILFNHESPRRGEAFVTRKITRALGRIRHGQQDTLYLGNLEARRDWGYAGDYVEAMWRMLQQDEPDDYVIATGQAHSVAEFCQRAFEYCGLDYRDYVEMDTRYLRPAEVDLLLGDASKAKAKLGWRPRVGFDVLIGKMIEHDLELAGREKTLRDAGHPVPIKLAA